MDYYARIQEAAESLRGRSRIAPRVGLILGSGLGGVVESVKERAEVPYGEVPHMPVSTVAGHAGRFVLGLLSGVPVMVMQGRFHYYEGYPMTEVTLGVRVMKALGVETLVVTNAAGGCNPAFVPGDLMLIQDHINMLPNPLLGPNDERLGTRFPAMTNAYAPRLRALCLEAANRLGLTLRSGVYIGVTGPSFETPSEYEAFRRLGADAVGMSTVPEVIVARHAGMEVCGLSLISNVGGLAMREAPSHEEVQTAGALAAKSLSTLLTGLVGAI